MEYAYDEYGRLSEHVDLGGNRWAYQYRGDLLVGIVDPNGNVPLAAIYDDGRVRAVNAQGVKTFFEFAPDRTRVTRSVGETVVRHNADGIAYQVVNPIGTVTTLELDEHNRPIRLDRDGNPLAHLRYDRDGRLVGIGRSLSGRQFERGRGGRLSRRYGEPHDEPSAIVDEFGNVKSLTLADGAEYSLEYNPDGQITAITDAPGRRATLEHDPAGRLAAIGFADGAG